MKNRTLVVLVACLCLASLGSVPGTSALFTDTEANAGGTVEAGTLDLKLDEVGPATRAATTDESQRDAVGDTWEDRSHDDGLFGFGSTPVENTLRIDNTQSSLDAEQVGFVVSYTESDGCCFNGGNPGRTARTIRLTRFAYDGTSLLGAEITDENGNGRLDVDDLTRGQTAENLASLSGVGAGDTADLTVEFSGNKRTFDGVTSGDGIAITLRMRGSAESFTDSDVSTSNTIRYG